VIVREVGTLRQEDKLYNHVDLVNLLGIVNIEAGKWLPLPGCCGAAAAAHAAVAAGACCCGAAAAAHAAVAAGACCCGAAAAAHAAVVAGACCCGAAAAALTHLPIIDMQRTPALPQAAADPG
jgi:hypothetical protein